MAAVDAPPGLAYDSLSAGEFAARRGPRRLARFAFVYCVSVGAIALALARRSIHSRGIEVLLVGALFCMALSALGHAVRAARIRVDRDGVRWGWRGIGFRLRRERLVEARVYRDAVALRPKRGSTWYLSRRDWDQFDGIPAALRRAAIPFTDVGGRTPIAARLQSYGVVLDGLEVLAAALVTIVALIAS